MPDQLERWEHRLEWPLAVTALVFLAAYSIEVLAQPRGWALTIVLAVEWATWVAFTVDYLVRLWMADDRKRWFLRHLVDLGIVVLPFVRSLRLLRVVVLISALQVAVGTAIRGRVIIYTVSGAVLLVYAASLTVLEAERPYPDAHIQHFGDALWWSITTITTVGYGDLYPVSTSGRIIAALLMIGGISLVGSITATLASWIVQRVAEEDEANQTATARQVEELRVEVSQLTEALRRRAGE